MNSKWDGDKGGRKQWIAWMTEVMTECLRVLKPGGHAFVWALPRTSHWTATAIEEAGFEIRDKVYHLFGSGFPKSLSVGKQIDKAAGAEREVISTEFYGPDGKRRTGGRLETNEYTSGDYGTYSGNAAITAPATPEAHQWQGWGTALKPAAEEWILARKPLVGTVAENVLAWGTGAINVDGCRVGTDENTARPFGHAGNNGGYANQFKNIPRGTMTGGNLNGRWPANLVHDGSEEVLEVFERAGERNGATSNSTGKPGDVMRLGLKSTETAPGYGDTGSAARFFMTCKETDEEWLHRHGFVNIAAENLNLQNHHADFALNHAVTAVLPEGIHSSVSKAPFTSVTPSELRQLVMSVIAAIQNLEGGFWRGLLLERNTVLPNGVSVAVDQTQIDTTTITVSHWRLDGSADPVTFNITPKNLEHGEVVSRFNYCAKSSQAERNFGLDGMPKRVANTMDIGEDTGRDSSKPSNAVGGQQRRIERGLPPTEPRVNHHPTVKSLELMRWLVRLVTPPGGIVLDPFTGSGTTGLAARLEGFRFIGCELNPEYIEIAERRIEAADRLVRGEFRTIVDESTHTDLPLFAEAQP